MSCRYCDHFADGMARFRLFKCLLTSELFPPHHTASPSLKDESGDHQVLAHSGPGAVLSALQVLILTGPVMRLLPF